MNRCIEIDLKSYKKSISKLSYDKDKNTSLCKFKNKFFDFEEIVKLKRSDELPKAVDMLYINEEKKEVWFIEFKNRYKEKVDKYDVKRKILDSLISFYELFEKVYCCKYLIKYFVVYKCEDDIHMQLFDEFEDREIYFDLKEIKNKFLDEIVTECCDYFLEFFNKNYNIEWKGD